MSSGLRHALVHPPGASRFGKRTIELALAMLIGTVLTASLVVAAVVPEVTPATCAPGSGDDFTVGPGQDLATIGEVPWEDLGAGDTVRIAYRPEPYREKFLVSAHGTEANPFKVCGIRGPNGERPIIDGQNATTRAQIEYVFPTSDERGVILVTKERNESEGTKPTHVEISGLEIRNAHPTNTFTKPDGVTVASYRNNAAGIFVERAEHVTIRDNVITGNGNGIFVASGDEEARVSRDILVESNHVLANGVAGRTTEHNTYTEAHRVTYQYNRIGGLVPGADGTGIKDRSAGLVVRYNNLENGRLDLVEADEAWPVFRFLPEYRETFVYGNTFFSGLNGTTSAVHYGGDLGVLEQYRKGMLYFYNNVVVHKADQNCPCPPGRFYSQVFQLSSDEETVDVRNNIFYVESRTEGATPTDLRLMRFNGTAIVGPNLASPGMGMFRPTDPNNTTGTIEGFENIQDIPGNEPGFASLENLDFHLVEGSPAIDASGPLHEATAAHPVAHQYVLHQSGEPRGVNGDAPDMGAFESPFSSDPDPDPDPDPGPDTGGGPPRLDFVPALGGPTPGSPCGASVLCVAPTGGTHTSIQAAVDAAQPGDTIQVAAGTYNENVVSDKPLTLLGGFPAGGGFATRDPASNPTVIDGGDSDSTVVFSGNGASTIDGFDITGGAAVVNEFDQSFGGGVRGGYGFGEVGSLTVSNNVIEGNDAPGSSGFGGGVSVRGATMATITGNVIRGNTAGRGAAVDVVGDALVARNLVENNHASGDHGGGLYLTGSDVRVEQNLVRGNSIGEGLGYGWGGGAFFYNPGASSVFERNRYVGNAAPSNGSGFFLDEGASAHLLGELFHDNVCPETGSPGIYVDGGESLGSNAVIENVTVANHGCSGDRRGSGLYVEGGSSAEVLNSIFTGNGGVNEINLCHDVDPEPQPCHNEVQGADSSVRYSLVEGGEGGIVGGNEIGPGILGDDPAFVSAATDDYRLAVGSPAVDAADPASAVGDEPAPNGGRRNAGAYGGTTEATVTGTPTTTTSTSTSTTSTSTTSTSTTSTTTPSTTTSTSTTSTTTPSTTTSTSTTSTTTPSTTTSTTTPSTTSTSTTSTSTTSTTTPSTTTSTTSPSSTTSTTSPSSTTSTTSPSSTTSTTSPSSTTSTTSPSSTTSTTAPSTTSTTGTTSTTFPNPGPITQPSTTTSTTVPSSTSSTVPSTTSTTTPSSSTSTSTPSGSSPTTLAPPPPGSAGPSASLTDADGRPTTSFVAGSVVLITTSGLAPDTVYDIVFAQSPGTVIGNATTDASGTLRTDVRIPLTARNAPGTLSFEPIGSDVAALVVAIEVTAAVPRDSLPRTGWDRSLVLYSLMMLLLGGVAAGTSRRLRAMHRTLGSGRS